MLLSRRQLECVKVSIRNPDVLSLSASVWSHGNIAISTASKTWIDTCRKMLDHVVGYQYSYAFQLGNINDDDLEAYQRDRNTVLVLSQSPNYYNRGFA